METIKKLDDERIKIIITYECIMTKKDLLQEKEQKEREIFIYQEELDKVNSKLDVLKVKTKEIK